MSSRLDQRNPLQDFCAGIKRQSLTSSTLIRTICNPGLPPKSSGVFFFQILNKTLGAVSDGLQAPAIVIDDCRAGSRGLITRPASTTA